MKRTTSHPQQPSSRQPAGPAGRPTIQRKLDDKEKRKHNRFENELESSQDKNTVPPDATHH